MPGTRNGQELGHEAEQENNQRLDEQEAEINKAQRLEQEETREAQSYEPEDREAKSSGGEVTAERVRADRAARSERGAPPEQPQKI